MPNCTLNRLESAAVPEPPAEKTDIHMRLVQRKIRKLAQQHREVECRPAKRHEQVIWTERFCKPTGIQRITADEGGHLSMPIEPDHGNLTEAIGLDVETNRPRTQPVI